MGKRGRCWVGKLPYGGDLLLSLEEFALRENVRAARVEVIGAVKKAVVSFYDQNKRQYESLTFAAELEITSCMGTVSMRQGKPAAHLHITLGERDGRVWGGHLAAGTVIFAGEFFMEELLKVKLTRGYDQNTGLPLWAEGEGAGGGHEDG